MIAGYTLLLTLSAVFSDLQRRQQHQRLVQLLATQVEVAQLDPALLRGFEVEALLLPRGPELLPRLQHGETGEQWLVSRSQLKLANGELRWLELRQNVTSSLEQQRMTGLLLIAAAVISMLFTALLLQPVLRRGLVAPLNDFDQQLRMLEADNLGENLLDPAMQPQELRLIAEAFNNLQQRLSAAWQRERAFVDGITHELRTPITVISGYAQRLQRQALPGSADRSVEMIRSEVRRMADLLNGLRDLAHSDAGSLRIAVQQLDPGEQLLNAYEASLLSSQGRLQLPHIHSERLPTFHADPDRLQQCLQALIENALLYSSGVVQLQAEISDEWLVLHVLDQGAGIAEAERPIVMQRFKRGSSSVGTRGTGIGLPLVDGLMRAMSGELLISTTPAGGADVQLRFRPASDGR